MRHRAGELAVQFRRTGSEAPSPTSTAWSPTVSFLLSYVGDEGIRCHHRREPKARGQRTRRNGNRQQDAEVLLHLLLTETMAAETTTATGDLLPPRATALPRRQSPRAQKVRRQRQGPHNLHEVGPRHEQRPRRRGALPASQRDGPARAGPPRGRGARRDRAHPRRVWHRLRWPRRRRADDHRHARAGLRRARVQEEGGRDRRLSRRYDEPSGRASRHSSTGSSAWNGA